MKDQGVSTGESLPIGFQGGPDGRGSNFNASSTAFVWDQSRWEMSRLSPESERSECR